MGAETTAEDGLEITELEKFEVTRVDGVQSPANGFPVLMMKGLPANLEPPTQAGFTGTYGGVPAPDADAGEGQGCGCCPDCHCPPAAAKGAPEEGGWWVYPSDSVAKAHREFSAADRKENASAGNALPDGSYPIPDADALRRAAILARSKHGNWKAARRLIAKRAKELGVANPLASSDGGGKPKAKAMAAAKSVAEGGSTVDTGAQGTGGLAKAVEDAVTKATEPLLKRITDLESANKAQAGELAEVKAKPLPGGPMLQPVQASATSDARKARLLTEAEDAERLANTLANPTDSAAYAKLAAHKRAEAAQA